MSSQYSKYIENIDPILELETTTQDLGFKAMYIYPQTPLCFYLDLCDKSGERLSNISGYFCKVIS